MPSTIKSYAIDYDGNNKIELKTSLEDSLASAANYINKIGWKRGEPCFYKVKLSKKINKKYLNSSARKITYRKKISKWKEKGVVIFDIEAVFLYPWAVAFTDLSFGAFLAMGVFILLLAESLIYLWIKGVLTWK